MSDCDDFLEELLQFAHDVAKQAGQLILDGSKSRWASTAENQTKKNPVDLVTVTDQAVETYIKEAIYDRYPSHKFIGEESFAAGEREPLTDEYTWIVDPIDGTMNFVHFNPFVACSIGITHRKRPVVGVIAQPFLGRVMSARLGGGARMNRTIPLPLTGGIAQPLAGLSQCLIIGEWGSDRSETTFKAKSRSFTKLIGDPAKGIDGGRLCHAMRTYGSSACNIAAVAAGEADVYWYVTVGSSARSWFRSVNAGSIILTEAGGFVSGGSEALLKNLPIEEVLMKRRYIFVRAIAGDAQHVRKMEIAHDLYDTVEPWATEDMRDEGL